MTEEESAFVEEMGQALAGYGMTPMAGRMWGWLLICDPPEQTAGDIADALHEGEHVTELLESRLAGLGAVLDRDQAAFREFTELPVDPASAG